MYKVSVIISTHNRPKLLNRTMESIHNQTFRDFEVIVVDDGSRCKKDNEIVLDEYIRKGMKIRYIYQENRGAPAARNKGIQEAQGEYIALVDDDDEWLQEKFEKQIKLLKRSSEKVGLVYSWVKGVDEKGNLLRKMRPDTRGHVLKEILKRNFVPLSSVLIKKECFVKVGLFDERFPSCQDWEMWTKIAAEYEFDVVKDFLAKYYKHKDYSVGDAPNAILGYYMYFMKFKELYLKLGLKRDLSKKLSWTGYELLKIGKKDKSKECFSLSFDYDKYNLKGYVRWLLGKLRLWII